MVVKLYTVVNLYTVVGGVLTFLKMSMVAKR